MGICGSALSPQEIEEMKVSQRIDKNMVSDFKKAFSFIKLLFLGSGESGKSTVFKQMKILYGEGFPEGSRQEFKLAVHSNTLEAMKSLCVACQTFGIMDQVLAKAEFEDIVNISNQVITHKGYIDERYAAAIKALWSDPAIQEAWQRRSQVQVIDSCKYYFDDIDRISAVNYVPTVEDILRTRVRTSGIVEEHFQIEDTDFLMIDVGGQRNERKKWIHQFDHVNAIIFVAALSEFDQYLFEDNSSNRMIDAIDLFDKICNNEYFLEIPILLFLNKRDLFEEKIKTVNIADVSLFSDYSGRPNDYADGVQYFKDKFVAINKNPNKSIFAHETCATDTAQIQFVFNSCKKIILSENLSKNGFLH